MTFEVGDGCQQVPKELRTRTYEAKIGYYKSIGSADWFFAELSGSKFHRYHPVLYFNYCAVTSDSGVQNECSLDAMVRSLCRSENSRWTLTRR